MNMGDCSCDVISDHSSLKYFSGQLLRRVKCENACTCAYILS